MYFIIFKTELVVVDPENNEDFQINTKTFNLSMNF